MFLRSYCRVLVAVALAFATSLAFAVAYCAKPNGIATRDLAYQQLTELREDLAKRFGGKARYAIIASVPDTLQRSSEFKKLENAETVRQASLVPEIQQRAAEWAKEQGFSLSPEAAARQYVRDALSNRTSEPHEPIGLMYLYSNDRKILRKISPDIAHQNGIVVEGEPSDINALLQAKPADAELFGWWKKNIPSDLDLLIFAGFSPAPEVRELVRRETQVLRIGSWEAMTEGKLKGYRALMDVKPDDATVLNLFPLSKSDAADWGMSPEVSAAYVSNGQKLQSDIQKLGYNAQRPANVSSTAEVLDYLRSQTSNGKTVLIYAETTQLPNSEYLMRLPGQTGGLTAKDLLSLDDSVLAKLLVVSCNSQALSSKLPLTIVGTIYTDSAASLVRQTFASPQADRFGDYLQASTVRTTSWLEPVARVSTDIERVSLKNQDRAIVSEGALKFRPVAYVAQVTRPPVPAQTQAQPVPESGDTRAEPPTKGAPNAPSLFFAGVFGAVCREGLRWRRLVEQKRARAFLRLPYILLSALMVIAAGGVAYVFGQQISSPSYALLIAFVAGVGFEKIVKLAAELKIWAPSRPVPMGPATTADLEQELRVGETLAFLRHGD